MAMRTEGRIREGSASVYSPAGSFTVEFVSRVMDVGRHQMCDGVAALVPVVVWVPELSGKRAAVPCWQAGRL